jgi:diacylglycerol kinase (ATP)
LLARGIELAAAYPVRKPAQMNALIRHEIAAGRKTIVVGGGDGTVTMVAGCFAGSDAVLGLLPLGTGNSFAQGLGIPADIARAADVIAGGREVAVDLGMLDGKPFVNFATVGLSSVVARETTPFVKRIFGPVGYVLTGIVLMARHRAFTCRLEADDGLHEFKTHQLVVANGRIFGVTPLHPDARLDEGKLTVFAVPGASRRQIRRTWMALLSGRHADLSDAMFLSTTKLALTTEPRRRIEVDGETVGRTPALFAVARRALRVFAPATFEAFVS